MTIKYGYHPSKLIYRTDDELREALCTTDGCGAGLKAAIIATLEERAIDNFVEDLCKAHGFMSITHMLTELNGLQQQVEDLRRENRIVSESLANTEQWRKEACEAIREMLEKKSDA